MKATLTFDLPEEKSDLLVCLKGNSYLVALWDLDQWLRRKCKYGDNKPVGEGDFAEEVQTQLRKEMECHGCSLEDGEE